MLILSEENELLSSTYLNDLFDEHCWTCIMDMCRTVTKSQFSLLSVLYGLSHILSVGAQNLMPIAICVAKALKLPSDGRVAPIIRPLICRLQILKTHNGPLWSNFRLEEEEAALQEADITIDRLGTHLASMLIYGPQNLQTLSCARADRAYPPATGWLPVYLD